jgi:hypothetical protein
MSNSNNNNDKIWSQVYHFDFNEENLNKSHYKAFSLLQWAQKYFRFL